MINILSPKNNIKNRAIKFKKGFTLAELLIVISILGIVASLTIFNIYTNHKKLYIEVRLKKAFAVLDNALGILESENGGPNYFKTEVRTDEQLLESLKTVLNVSSECNYDKNNQTTPCFAGPNGNPYDIEGTRAESRKKGLILKDGMSFVVASYCNCGCYDILVDIDGPYKGPSLLGYDVFMFSYGKYGWYKYDGRTKCPGSNSRNQECPILGLTPGASAGWCTGLDFYADNNTIKNYYQRGCAKNVGKAKTGGWNTRGVSCSILIAKNNWKIPKDYPWDLVTKTPAGFTPLKH